MEKIDLSRDLFFHLTFVIKEKIQTTGVLIESIIIPVISIQTGIVLKNPVQTMTDTKHFLVVVELEVCNFVFLHVY